MKRLYFIIVTLFYTMQSLVLCAENSCLKQEISSIPIFGDRLFGDAIGYYHTGKLHAKEIKSKGIVRAVIDNPRQVRPLGIGLYAALPFLFTEDVLLQFHLIILINLIIALIITLLLTFLFDTNPSFTVKKMAYVFLLSTCLVPFIPILMSDAISLMFFLLGIYLLNKISIEKYESEHLISRKHILVTLSSGLFFAFSGLMKQNYILYTVFYILSFAFVHRKLFLQPKQLANNLKMTVYFSIGFSFVLTQFLFIFYNYGIFWPYVPSVMAFFSRGHEQPYVELFAYNFPNQSAFNVQLDHSVSAVTFYLLRLYRGLTSVYLPIYHGNPPVNPFLTLTNFDLIKIYGFFLLFCAFTYLIYKKYSDKYKILILSAFLVAIHLCTTTNVENRYYLYPRLIYGLFIINCLIDCLSIPYLRSQSKKMSY